MKVTHTELPGVLLIDLNVYGDERGYFYETYNEREFRTHTGVDVRFVQDNYSRSAQGALRGLHYQTHEPQGKYVHVVAGDIYDVVVDLRRASPTFGKWIAMTLSDTHKCALWIPPGLAHGFLALSAHADVLYKTTTHRHAAAEQCIAWNDPVLGIQWPLSARPILTARDSHGTPFPEAPTFGD